MAVKQAANRQGNNSTDIPAGIVVLKQLVFSEQLWFALVLPALPARSLAPPDMQHLLLSLLASLHFYAVICIFSLMFFLCYQAQWP